MGGCSSFLTRRTPDGDDAGQNSIRRLSDGGAVLSTNIIVISRTGETLGDSTGIPSAKKFFRVESSYRAQDIDVCFLPLVLFRIIFPSFKFLVERNREQRKSYPYQCPICFRYFKSTFLITIMKCLI